MLLLLRPLLDAARVLTSYIHMRHPTDSQLNPIPNPTTGARGAGWACAPAGT